MDRAELRKLAEAVQQGDNPAALSSRMAFVSAASPDVVLELLDEIERLHMIFRDNVIVPEDEYRLITQATKNTSILLDLKASLGSAVKRSVAAEMERDQLRAVAVRLKGALIDTGHNTDCAFWRYTIGAASKCDCGYREIMADPEVEKL